MWVCKNFSHFNLIGAAHALFCTLHPYVETVIDRAFSMYLVLVCPLPHFFDKIFGRAPAGPLGSELFVSRPLGIEYIIFVVFLFGFERVWELGMEFMIISEQILAVLQILESFPSGFILFVPFP